MSTLFRVAIVTSVGFLLLLATTFVGNAPSALAASTLTVTTTADLNTCTNGTLSLRCALNQANAASSGDTITFNIPTSDPGCVASVCTLSPTNVFNALPQLKASNTIINGYTQPGAKPNTNPLSAGNNAVLTIRIDGAKASGTDAFFVTGSADTIKGIDITNFNQAITASGTGHVTVQGNFIGIAPNGLSQGLNATGVGDNSNGGGGLTVGGTNRADGNVISGNFIGVFLGSGDTFQGNIVGLDATGHTPIVNLLTGGLPSDGVVASGSHIVIGGTSSGSGNVISGNASGIRMSGSSNLIEGNLIGTNANGKAAIGNEEGITFTSSNSTIGGLIPAARNIISGNFNFGIDMAESSGMVVEGNFIGTDVTGTTALGNGGNNGATAQASAGVFLSAERMSATNNIIGGSTSAARNVISGNAFNGIQITVTSNSRFNANTENNLVQGNFIGLDATGTQALANGTEGVYIASSMGFSGQLLNNAVKNNVIAHNGKSGILIGIASTDKVVHSPISQNSLFANGGLGIDLAPEGVVNCSTHPPGPNDYTPCPIIAQATATQIKGTAPAGSTVEVFIASNKQSNQGQTFLGSASANASGNWSLMLTTGKVAQGQFVTATATTSGTIAETSEFAANVVVH